MGNLPVTIELAHDRVSSLWSQYHPKIADSPSIPKIGARIPEIGSVGEKKEDTQGSCVSQPLLSL